MFKSLQDFSELDFIRDKYSTYPSRSKEHHAGGDLFGKQHEIVVVQILSSSLTKIISIPHSSAFSQVAKQITTWQVLHDEYGVNLSDVKQEKKQIKPMSRLLIVYQKQNCWWLSLWSSLAYRTHCFRIYLHQNLPSKICYRLKGESRLAPLTRFQAVRPDLNELLMDTCSRRKTVWLPHKIRQTWLH